MTAYTVKSLRPSTAEELAARQRLKEMAANQLPSVRQAAERWRNGAGLSGGAVAVAALLTAPEVLGRASDGQLHQGLLVMAGTVLVALAAMGSGLRASFGWPAVQNIASADALRRWEQREVSRSICFLRISMILTAITVVLASVAGAVLLFGLDLTTFHLVPAEAPSPSPSR